MAETATVCAVCGEPLAPYPGRGRPATYCKPECKAQARAAARRERNRARWAKVYAAAQANQRAARMAREEDVTAEEALARVEAINEAKAAIVGAERAVMLAMLPAEVREIAERADPADDREVFALVAGGPLAAKVPGGLGAVRICRHEEDPDVVFVELFSEGLLVTDTFLALDADDQAGE